MKVHCRMRFQPRQHFWSLVSGRVIQHHVQVSFLVSAVECLKKPQKIRPSVGFGAFPDYRTRSDVQSGIQADQPIAFVIVRLPGRQPRTYRQHRLSAAERLNLSFLIETNNDSVVGRVQVEADNIIDFLFRFRIAAELKCFDPVRFESMRLPDA